MVAQGCNRPKTPWAENQDAFPRQTSDVKLASVVLKITSTQRAQVMLATPRAVKPKVTSTSKFRVEGGAALEGRKCPNACATELSVLARRPSSAKTQNN